MCHITKGTLYHHGDKAPMSFHLPVEEPSTLHHRHKPRAASPENHVQSYSPITIRDGYHLLLHGRSAKRHAGIGRTEPTAMIRIEPIGEPVS